MIVKCATYVEQVVLERAELAAARGDPVERQRQLAEARRLFTEIGASGHAERLAALA